MNNLPKKILISYYEFPPIAFELKAVFEKLGIETELFITSQNEHWFYNKVIKRVNKLARNLRLVKKGYDFFPKHPLNRLNYLSGNFYIKYKQFNPDLIIFIHGIAYANDVLTEIMIPKIGWWTEPIDDIKMLCNNAKPFDLYNSFSQNAINFLKSKDFSTEYLCHAFNPEKFYKINRSIQNIDIVFVGNWSPWREDVIKVALGVTSNIHLFGPGWRKKSSISKTDMKKIFKGKNLVGFELNQLFNSAKIVLNASRNRGSSGLNMRFFEVPATGACFLTDWVPEVEIHFIPEYHISVFTNLKDLQTKISKLLKDTNLRKDISKNGYNHVLENYTYNKLGGKLLVQYKTILKG